MFFAWGSPTFVICALLGWLVMDAILKNRKDNDTRNKDAAPASPDDKAMDLYRKSGQASGQQGGRA
jgi:hypothetical protein